MVDETLKCIREGTIALLKEKEYDNIQMKEIAERSHVGRRTLYRYFDSKEKIVRYIAESLMDRFTDEIKMQEGLTLVSISYAFYLFIEKNKTEFLLLKKARLLYLIEDNFFELIAGVAQKTKYKDLNAKEFDQMLASMSREDKYALHFTFAGYWRMAMLWLEEENHLSPKQMTELTVKIMTGGK